MAASTEYARGAAMLCVGIAAYIVQDLIIKIASGHYPIHQALVVRAVTAIPIAVGFIYWSGTLKAIRGQPGPCCRTACSAWSVTLPTTWPSQHCLWRPSALSISRLN